MSYVLICFSQDLKGTKREGSACQPGHQESVQKTGGEPTGWQDREG